MSEEELENTLQRLAQKVCTLGLEMPAVFLLEAHLPLCTLLHQGSLLIAPVASPLFGSERVSQWQHILYERKNIERLIELIETQSGLQSGASSSGKTSVSGKTQASKKDNVSTQDNLNENGSALP